MNYKIYPKLMVLITKRAQDTHFSPLINLSVPWSTWEAINFPNRKNYVAGDLAIKVINNKLRN